MYVLASQAGVGMNGDMFISQLFKLRSDHLQKSNHTRVDLITNGSQDNFPLPDWCQLYKDRRATCPWSTKSCWKTSIVLCIGDTKKKDKWEKHRNQNMWKSWSHAKRSSTGRKPLNLGFACYSTTLQVETDDQRPSQTTVISLESQLKLSTITYPSWFLDTCYSTKKRNPET